MSSFRIIGTHPYFGIGAGQYYRDAPLFLTPQLAWTYGYENAHNNLLQITTETGIIGFALFACWVAGSLQLAVRALVRVPHDWRLLGAAAGVAAFIGTCLTSHPLLVQEVSLVSSSSALDRRGARRFEPAQPVDRRTDLSAGMANDRPCGVLETIAHWRCHVARWCWPSGRCRRS
jgi:hypothetical protein